MTAIVYGEPRVPLHAGHNSSLCMPVPLVLPLGCRQVNAEAQKRGNRQAHAHIWEPGAAVYAGDLGTNIASLAPLEAERIMQLALIPYGKTLPSTVLSHKLESRGPRCGIRDTANSFRPVVDLGTSLNLSESRFSHLESKDYNNIYIVCIWQSLT